MKILFPAAELMVAPGESVAIREGLGWTITCESGTAWLTQQHDTRDVVLSPGESFRLDRSGLAVVHALRLGKIRLRLECSQPMRPQRSQIGFSFAPPCQCISLAAETGW